MLLDITMSKFEASAEVSGWVFDFLFVLGLGFAFFSSAVEGGGVGKSMSSGFRFPVIPVTAFWILLDRILANRWLKE